jgi:hypothetical protein
LHAPLLINLDAREGWSRMEDDLNTYMEEHSQHVEDDGKESKIILSSPPTLRSSHTSNLIMIMGLLFVLLHESLITIMLMMIHQPRVITHVGIDIHLGQKPKLGGYTDISLISTSYSIRTLYIHVLLSFFFFVVLVLFLLSKTQKDQKYFCCFSFFSSLVSSIGLLYLLVSI